MKTSLYFIEYEKERIKNDLFYVLYFFDSFTGLTFKTYNHAGNMNEPFIKLLNNGSTKTIERLKKNIIV